MPTLPTPRIRSRAIDPAALRARLTVVLVATAALLLTVLAVPTRAHASLSRPTVPVRTATEKTLAAAVLTEFNLERAVHHLKPVRMNSQLQLSARRHNVVMARYNELSHQISSEPVFSKRISLAGFAWSWAGENIAFNSVTTVAGVLALQKMMYNERPPNDGHRVNILNPRFTDIGVDVLLDTVHHRAWLTTDLARH